MSKNNKLEKFMKLHRPQAQTSELEPYLEELLELESNNYTQDQMVQYLFESYGIKKKRQTVSAFLISRKGKNKDEDTDGLSISNDSAATNISSNSAINNLNSVFEN